MNHWRRSPTLLAALALGALVAEACTHVVQRPTKCGPPPPALGHSALGWQRVAAGGIDGSVVTPGGLTPLATAIIHLTRVAASTSEPAASLQANSDGEGRFRFDSVASGRYVLQVRRIGYQPVRDTIELHGDSGVVATAVLAMQIIRFDECGLTYEEVRVPWWKRKDQ